jgi:hypothetical protein
VGRWKSIDSQTWVIAYLSLFPWRRIFSSETDREKYIGLDVLKKIGLRSLFKGDSGMLDGTASRFVFRIFWFGIYFCS